jgi:hypothetical protein
MSGNIVEFEVSGRLFRESRTLLNQLDVHSSKLAKLFAGDIDLPTNDQGVPFLNRDSDAISHMLKHLKSDRKYVPKDLDSRELFHIELEHWGLENPTNTESREELSDQVRSLKSQIEQLQQSVKENLPIQIRGGTAQLLSIDTMLSEQPPRKEE